jgi:hypothetical protein
LFILFIDDEFIMSLMMLNGILIDFVLQQWFEALLLKHRKGAKDCWIVSYCGVSPGLLPKGENQWSKHFEVGLGELQQVLLIVVQQNVLGRRSCLEHAGEDLEHADLEDVVVGIEDDQVPQTIDELARDEVGQLFLDGEGGECEDGVDLPVALAHQHFVLVGDVGVVGQQLPHALNFPLQVVGEMLEVGWGDGEEAHAFVLLVYDSLLGFLQQTHKEIVDGWTVLILIYPMQLRI